MKLKMLNLKKWLLSNILMLFGFVLGGVSGYLYYYYIGCSNGTCAITSNPYKSVIYFSVWFAIVTGIIQAQIKEHRAK